MIIPTSYLLSWSRQKASRPYKSQVKVEGEKGGMKFKYVAFGAVENPGGLRPAVTA